MDEQFLRSAMLFGEEGIARLQAAHVALFGIGGAQKRSVFESDAAQD